MTATEHRFWDWFGKAITVASVAFVFACAIGFVALCVDAVRHADDPTFTVAPDTAKAHPKPRTP